MKNQSLTFKFLIDHVFSFTTTTSKYASAQII